jgi:membrane associated rhomboid family serine protease
VIFSLAFTPYPSVGASGAIFGSLGALGTFLFLHRDSLGAAGKAYLRRIAMVALLNLALGLAPNIDNWGHMGGLLAGSFLAWFLGPRLELNWVSHEESSRMIEGRPWREIWRRIFPAAILLAILAYLALISPFSR